MTTPKRLITQKSRAQLAIMGRCLMVGAVLGVSSSVFAGPWLGFTKLTQVYPHPEGVSVNTEHSYPQYSNCDEGRRFNLPVDHPNYEVMADALVEGFIAGKDFNLNIKTSGSEEVCQPEIDRFRVR